MPSTPNRGYSVPTHGSEVNTWDVPLNTNFGTMDSNLGAVTTVALSNANVVLTPTQYACGTIRFTGTITTNLIVTFPQVQARWIIDNRTVGNFYIVLVTGVAGENLAVPQGQASDIFIDGANIRFRNLMPPGSFWDYAGSSVPAWINGCTIPPFLNCDGSTYNTSTYPILAQILGTNVLPDARGRGRFTLDQSTGRITTGGSGINGSGVGAAGGAQNYLIGQANLPAITLPVTGRVIAVSNNANYLNGGTSNYPAQGTGVAPGPQVLNGSTVGTNVVTDTNILGSAISLNTGSIGSGAPLITMPPTYMGGLTLIRAA